MKAHPAHRGTSELVGRAIRDAVRACGLPAGTFSLVLGAGNAIGEALVAHPAIKAVGFTGSRAGGLALADVAARRPALFTTTQHAFLADRQLQQEIFGPASLCRDLDEMVELAEHLDGQLTATLHLDEDDTAHARRLLPTLERKAGRIVANGYPTGVEVAHAMVHGGPFPATSDARTTSVGTLAIERFLRPICYQDLPAALLPDALRDGNPLGIARLVDGTPGTA
ncbi:acyl-CoA reductase-like NAD-dependent aldehyde dehydrogenase [Paraburkholderia youngii]